MTDDDEPVFDPKGRYLYFTSNRDFNLTFSAFEFNYVYTDPTRVYVGVLAADGPALFLPQSDEEKATAAPPPAAPETTKPTRRRNAEADAKKKSAPVVVKIDRRRIREARARHPRTVRQLRQPRARVAERRPLHHRHRRRRRAQALQRRRPEGRDDRRAASRGYDLSANGEKIARRAAATTFAIVSAEGRAEGRRQRARSSTTWR